MGTRAKRESSGSTEDQPKVGQVWWIIGAGPLQIVELPDPPGKTTFTMANGAGERYMAEPAQLLYHFSQTQLKSYEKNCKERNMPFTPFSEL